MDIVLSGDYASDLKIKFKAILLYADQVSVRLAEAAMADTASV